MFTWAQNIKLLTYPVTISPWCNRTGWLGVKHQVTYSVTISPWYNRTGWLGVKHQVTYSLPIAHSQMPPGWPMVKPTWHCGHTNVTLRANQHCIELSVTSRRRKWAMFLPTRAQQDGSFCGCFSSKRKRFSDCNVCSYLGRGTGGDRDPRRWGKEGDCIWC